MATAHSGDVSFLLLLLCAHITCSLQAHLPQHVKNSTSLTANIKLLLNLYISTLLVLKLTLILTFLRPTGSLTGGTAATFTWGYRVVYIWYCSDPRLESLSRSCVHSVTVNVLLLGKRIVHTVGT